MARVEIYSKMMCPYCARAKSLFRQKGQGFEETDITFGGDKRGEMLARAGGRSTVPQIFIDGAHVGGCDDLFALERAGKLDPMLGL